MPNALIACHVKGPGDLNLIGQQGTQLACCPTSPLASKPSMSLVEVLAARMKREAGDAYSSSSLGLLLWTHLGRITVTVPDLLSQALSYSTPFFKPSGGSLREVLKTYSPGFYQVCLTWPTSFKLPIASLSLCIMLQITTNETATGPAYCFLFPFGFSVPILFTGQSIDRSAETRPVGDAGRILELGYSEDFMEAVSLCQSGN